MRAHTLVHIYFQRYYVDLVFLWPLFVFPFFYDYSTFFIKYIYIGVCVYVCVCVSVCVYLVFLWPLFVFPSFTIILHFSLNIYIYRCVCLCVCVCVCLFVCICKYL